MEKLLSVNGKLIGKGGFELLVAALVSAVLGFYTIVYVARNLGELGFAVFNQLWSLYFIFTAIISGLGLLVIKPRDKHVSVPKISGFSTLLVILSLSLVLGFLGLLICNFNSLSLASSLVVALSFVGGFGLFGVQLVYAAQFIAIGKTFIASVLIASDALTRLALIVGVGFFSSLSLEVASFLISSGSLGSFAIAAGMKRKLNVSLHFANKDQDFQFIKEAFRSIGGTLYFSVMLLGIPFLSSILLLAPIKDSDRDVLFILTMFRPVFLMPLNALQSIFVSLFSKSKRGFLGDTRIAIFVIVISGVFSAIALLTFGDSVFSWLADSDVTISALNSMLISASTSLFALSFLLSIWIYSKISAKQFQRSWAINFLCTSVTMVSTASFDFGIALSLLVGAVCSTIYCAMTIRKVGSDEISGFKA